MVESRLVFKLESFLKDHEEFICLLEHRVQAKGYMKREMGTWGTGFEEVYGDQNGDLVENGIACRQSGDSEVQVMNAGLAFLKEDMKLFYILRYTGWGAFDVKVISNNHQEMRRAMGEFIKEYVLPNALRFNSSNRPFINLMVRDKEGFHLRRLEVEENRLQNEEGLKKHFGDSVMAYEAGVLEAMKTSVSGVHVLSGQPGTGKTSFLNHLSAKVAKSHRVVYLPVSFFSVAFDSPESLDFWIDLAQRKGQRDQKTIVIVEDAEALIHDRSKGSSMGAQQVSTLLNLADGFLGKLLKLHLFLTVNAKDEDVDEAVLRSGRLKSYHRFDLLTKKQAGVLADNLGKELHGSKERFTLAEVYNGQSKHEVQVPAAIGFAK